MPNPMAQRKTTGRLPITTPATRGQQEPWQAAHATARAKARRTSKFSEQRPAAATRHEQKTGPTAKSEAEPAMATRRSPSRAAPTPPRSTSSLALDGLHSLDRLPDGAALRDQEPQILQLLLQALCLRCCCVPAACATGPAAPRGMRHASGLPEHHAEYNHLDEADLAELLHQEVHPDDVVENPEDSSLGRHLLAGLVHHAACDERPARPQTPIAARGRRAASKSAPATPP
mmetsp:Transcript_32057/g.90013  ORF Transcript_32057/g.90013 Transcript_32057/m.90013 type:complete len:231 (-) Transcript_32057:18-710(-)